PREGFLLTAVAWAFFGLFGGLPLMRAQLGLSFTDAYFEAISALTTTGSTVIEGLDNLSKGLLLWRAMMQGIGGMGIVVLAVALLPFLRVGGMQVFRAESSEKSDKPLPRAAQIALATVLAYLVLVVACMFTYWGLGMSLFDAICHAMTTMSTAGFSNYDASFGYFKSPALEWAATFYMMLAGLPLLAYVRMALGHWRDVWTSQIAWLLAITGVFVLAVAFWLWLMKAMPPDSALRLSAFNVVSILTTTGYASTDFNGWGGFPSIVFLMVMFIGGCAGSTSGGIKVMRFEILGQLGTNTLRRLVHRRGVYRLAYQGRPIGEDVIASVTLFCFVYFMSFAALAAALAATGLDFVTSVTGAAQAIGNIGPGLGEIIGPAGNFKSIPDAAKWLSVVGMIMGRLEFMAILVLFTRRFWRG
ncbi:MAG TPA: TrkH family potassium uptake protein, partial [Burkholderiales bacterium]|nr:TrkH family potassium uptake protein [Burkholderiales bacterium]